MFNTPSYEDLEQRVRELEQELKRHRDLFEHAPVGIFQSTLESGEFINLNPALARILAYPSTEACRASVRDIARDIYVLPEHRQKLLDMALERGSLLHFENEFRRQDGSVITGNLHLRVAHEADGSPAYLEGFIEDITEQKMIAKALKASEEHYRSIFENTGTGVLIVEDDMTITMVNAEFERLSGYSKAEVEGRMKWTEIVAYSDDLEKMIAYHRKRREKPELVPKNYEFTLIDKQNDKKHIFARVDVIPGTKKSLGSFIDITPLVQAQRSIRESESRLRGMLEAFEGFIYTCSSDYRIDFMNGLLMDIVGESGVDKPCHERIFGLSQPCPWCAGKRVFAGETVKQEFQSPRDGRWYYAVSSPIFCADDSVKKKQTVIIDIHDRKQAELEIKAREEHLQNENIRLKATIREGKKIDNIVGNSPGMQKVYELILRAAATDINVIIYGESGTGKELVARAIHDMSRRSRQSFVPVNCGAIPQHLLESEFFGYKKGAFTGAIQDKPGYLDHAENGSLFLDELGEIELNIQVKLLRVLEGGGYTPVGGQEVKTPDVRIIAATNRNLNELVKRGDMREDFFYRIHIIPIYLPPLRERREDIPLLVEHFLEKWKVENERIPLRGSMIESLMAYDWPGNVRELENTLQRYLNLDDLDFLSSPMNRAAPDVRPSTSDFSETDGSLRSAVNRFEKEYITRVLGRNRWNRKQSAGVLGIGRKTLYLKMRSLGIERRG